MLKAGDSFLQMASGNLVEALIRRTLLEDSIPGSPHDPSPRAEEAPKVKGKKRPRDGNGDAGGQKGSKVGKGRGDGTKTGAKKNAEASGSKKEKGSETKKSKLNDKIESLKDAKEKSISDCTQSGVEEQVEVPSKHDKGDAKPAEGETKMECLQNGENSQLNTKKIITENNNLDTLSKKIEQELAEKDDGVSDTVSSENASSNMSKAADKDDITVLENEQTVKDNQNECAARAPATLHHQEPKELPLKKPQDRVKSIRSHTIGGLTIASMIEKTLDAGIISSLRGERFKDINLPRSKGKDKGDREKDKVIALDILNPKKDVKSEQLSVISSSVSSSTSTNLASGGANKYSVERILAAPTRSENPKKDLLLKGIIPATRNVEGQRFDPKMATSSARKLMVPFSIDIPNPSNEVPSSSSVTSSGNSVGNTPPGSDNCMVSPDGSDESMSGNHSGVSDGGARSPSPVDGSSASQQNKKKKRKRCGVCKPCLTKQNCGECSSCKNRRTGHQICKQRKCVELRKKALAASGAGQSPVGLLDGGAAAAGSPRMKGVRPPPLPTTVGGTDGQDMSKATYLPNMPVSDGAPPPNQVVGKNGQVMQWNPAAGNAPPPPQPQMMNGYGTDQYPHHLANHHISQHQQQQSQLKGEDASKIGQELTRKESLPKMPPGEAAPKTVKEGKPGSKEHGLSAFSPTPDTVSKSHAPASTPPGMARELAERQYFEKMVQQQQQQQQKHADPHEIAAAAAAAAAAHRTIPPQSYPHHPHHLTMPHKPDINNHISSIKKEVLPPPAGGITSGTPIPPPDKKSLSPVDAAESLLSLSTTLPDKPNQYTTGSSFSHVKPSMSTMMLAPLPQPVKKESTSSKCTPVPRPSSEISSSSSAAPTKIPLNPLEPAHPDGVAARAEVQKLARQVPPSPYSNIMLPTILQKSDGKAGMAKTNLSVSSHSTSSIQAIQGGTGDKGEGGSKGTTLHPTPPTVDSLMERQKLEKGLQTPPRSSEKPLIETPEMKRMQLLSEDARIEAPNCGCLENDMDEAPYYTHLGTGPNLPAIRELVEKRSGFQGAQVRIEKVVYSGKEGKSSTGCPIAKWIIRRSSSDEKVLCLVRHRPGHHCDTSYIVIAIVAWEGVTSYEADDTYEMLRTTLPNGAIPTVRRCGTNEDKTCACQGFSPDSCGASFTFGCSWSMYYNTCKFARSRTPRKFKLLESNPEVEDTLSDRFQNMATNLGPLYKRLAPESFNNQIAFENEARECRLGKEGGRPFAGVTACMDFCAHAHKDQHNMNNGCTVVVTLTKEDIRNKRPAPGDEQLHVLPLYYLDSTDEFGNAEGQQNKVRNGSIEVLTHYRHKIRVHGGDPVVPKGAMKSRNSSSNNSSPGRAKAASAAAAQAQRELEREREKEKEKEREKEREREREREHEKRVAAAASAAQKELSASSHGIPKVEQPVPPHMNPQTMQMWPHYQQSMEALRAQWPGMEIPPGLVGGIRPESHHALMMMNGLHREMLTPGGSIPPEFAHMYAHYARFLPPGYVHPAMADIMLREQLQNNPAALARFMAPFGQDPYGGASSNPYMQFAAQYGADIKPDPAMLNNPRLEGFYSPYLSPHLTSPPSREPGREGSHIPSDTSKFPSPTLNGIRPDPHHPHTSQAHHPTSSSSTSSSSATSSSVHSHPGSSHSHKDGIWRPPIFQDSPKKEPNSSHHQSSNSSSHPPESRTPQKSPAYSPSVDKSIRPGDPRDPYVFRDDTPSTKPAHSHHRGSEGKSSKGKSDPHHLHQAPHPERLHPHDMKDTKPPLPIPSLQDPANTPPPTRNEEEYFSDSEKCFEDPTIGGVAIALTHGSVLFECAKRELHATTSVRNPCRQRPTRISLVFYQHKRMTYRNHGLELYEKKMAARSLEQENGDSPSAKGKKKRPASTEDSNKESSKKKKTEVEKPQIPTKCAVTPPTNTIVTLASYAFPTVTGPYQKWV